jgi:D-glycero-D-manno-heptose 1,7-bisphosphate phosphatase
MQKAIFLDRDGVINSDVGHYYIFKSEDFVLNEGLVEALQKWRHDGFIFIVISNQGGIARGNYTKQDVEKVHAKFLELMSDNNIHINDIYYCPHHNEVEKCLCRKPDSLMIEKAVARYAINISQSYLIGDNQKDVDAAAKVGLRGIKVTSNQNLLTIIDQIR